MSAREVKAYKAFGMNRSISFIENGVQRISVGIMTCLSNNILTLQMFQVKFVLLYYNKKKLFQGKIVMD